MGEELSAQRKLFAEAYAATMNATDAAIRAGYSKSCARQQGSRLMANVFVKEYVNRLLTEKSKGLKLTREALLKELTDLALGPGRDMVKMKAIQMAGEAIGLFGIKGPEDDGSGEKSKSDAVDAILETP